MRRPGNPSPGLDPAAGKGSDLRPRPSFQSSAPAGLSDLQLRENLRKAARGIRAKRQAVVQELPDWEELTRAGRRIKEEALGNLEMHLERLEDAVSRAGGTVHWARDGAEANRIIGDLVEGAGATEVVKVKSITTDEIGLNEALESRGISAVETDLAELIIQLASESSSHFLVPAIHKNRTQIRDLFRSHLGLPELTEDPADLTEAARRHLRRKFLSARVAISGANFACADTGTVGVVESEGNGRMCLTLPGVLITVMGIEKVLPAFRDLEVFLQLLPRSATGERMNPYTSLWTGVHPGDGPQEFHLVLLDNGRTRVLADPVGRQALHCIRCSACLNICPVYERVGGHAYNATYPGPIGSILTPQLLGPGVHDSLPFASTLCGACQEVCPVEIQIPRVLLHLRHRTVESGSSVGRIQEALAMGFLGLVFRSPTAYRLAVSLARLFPGRGLGAGWWSRLPAFARGWTAGRDFPAPARESFRDWWMRREQEARSEGMAEGGGEGIRPGRLFSGGFVKLWKAVPGPAAVVGMGLAAVVVAGLATVLVTVLVMGLGRFPGRTGMEGTGLCRRLSSCSRPAWRITGRRFSMSDPEP